MEAKLLSTAQQLSMDRIATLPEPIIETVLCRLPIEDAARTSILSTEWRYKWTTIPKLEFFESTVKRSIEENPLSNQEQVSSVELARRKKDTRYKLFHVINQALLQRQGPIHVFKLTMEADDTCYEINQIILHLSWNHTLKELFLYLGEPGSGSDNLCVVHLSVFSLRHLTRLFLCCCVVNLKPVFNGFGGLTSLALIDVRISSESLLHLLSSCPALKSLWLMQDDYVLDYKKPCIMELFKCLPLIERLTTWSFAVIPDSHVVDWVPKEFPISLIHLKYFSIEQLCFGDGHGLTFFGVLLKCSPNLEKIKIDIETNDKSEALDPVQLEEYSSILEKEYSDVWLERLFELEIKNYRNIKLESEFLKFIFSRSPKLKNVILRTDCCDWRKQLEMLRILLRRSPRALPVEFRVISS